MTADTVGGVWTCALDLARSLAGHGIRTVIATMGGPLQPCQRTELAALGDAVELEESTFRLEWMDSPWVEVTAAGEWLLALEQRYQPDLIHLNGYAHAALPWRAPKLVVAHSCVFSWWRAVKHCAPPPSWSRYHAVVRRGLEHADVVVAPTRAMLAALARNYGPTRQTRVIFNGRDPFPGYAPTLDTIAAKRPGILGAGRLWDEAKNLAVLASIAPRLPWPVRLAGDTRAPGGGATVSLRNVELLGRRSAAELAQEYSAAAIYAAPALYEPFGLSILEAALAGCALVLGDIPCLRELWDGAAVFVSPEDGPALRHALLDLIHDQPHREAFGRAALERARRYGTGRMAAAYLHTYAELLSLPPAEPRGALSASFA